jgi:DNA polymerase III epsilon subunit-like protein
MKMKLIVIDVETTGLDPARHGLAAVAALDMDDGQTSTCGRLCGRRSA